MSPSAGNALAALQVRAAGRRVLVAEDDDDLRLLLAVALRSQGYRVDEVSDGAALLEHLAGSHGTRAGSHAGRAGSQAKGPNRHAGDDPFDLLISDLHIPCLSGLDVLASLRDAASRLPVILITADHNPQPEALARRLGAAAYFHKPFDVCDLLTAVINVSPRVPAE